MSKSKHQAADRRKQRHAERMRSTIRRDIGTQMARDNERLAATWKAVHDHRRAEPDDDRAFDVIASELAPEIQAALIGNRERRNSTIPEPPSTEDAVDRYAYARFLFERSKDPNSPRAAELRSTANRVTDARKRQAGPNFFTLGMTHSFSLQNRRAKKANDLIESLPFESVPVDVLPALIRNKGKRKRLENVIARAQRSGKRGAAMPTVGATRADRRKELSAHGGKQWDKAETPEEKTWDVSTGS